MQCSTAIDFFNDGVLNDPMMATNHATHDLKLSTRRSGVWGSPSVFQADSLGTVADSGGTVYWLYLLEYSDSDSFETRFWQPLCRRSHFTVVAEHGRSGTKSADTISVDPDLSGGCRYPIFEAPDQEKPFLKNNSARQRGPRRAAPRRATATCTAPYLPRVARFWLEI